MNWSEQIPALVFILTFCGLCAIRVIFDLKR